MSYIEKTFFEISDKFSNSFIKNSIIYINLPFFYKKPIILSLLNIVRLKFTMYNLTILTCSIKLYVIGKNTFYNPDLFESYFP